MDMRQLSRSYKAAQVADADSPQAAQLALAARMCDLAKRGIGRRAQRQRAFGLQSRELHRRQLRQRAGAALQLEEPTSAVEKSWALANRLAAAVARSHPSSPEPEN